MTSAPPTAVAMLRACALSTLLALPAAGKWWEDTHFAERVLNARYFGKTFKQVEAMLPQLDSAGYTVLNLDWPVEAGPVALYGGFGAKNFMNVEPSLA
eukprot:gene17298-23469_t